MFKLKHFWHKCFLDISIALRFWLIDMDFKCTEIFKFYETKLCTCLCILLILYVVIILDEQIITNDHISFALQVPSI